MGIMLGYLNCHLYYFCGDFTLFSGLGFGSDLPVLLSGPAESVRLLRFWPDQFFSQGKNKIPFLQKASNKQSASVILGLIRLIILSYNYR